MFAGGIAEKLGNEFEWLWTRLVMLRIAVNEDLTAIRPEPIGFDGVEFFVRNAKGPRAWHQVKTRSSDGPWTIARLRSRGVLPAFWARLEHTTDDSCVFVTNCEALSFATLCDRASGADSLQEFEARVGDSKDAQTAWRDLLKYYPNPETNWRVLQKCNVWTLSSTSISVHFDELCRAHFTAEPEVVADCLRQLLMTRLNRTIDTAELLNALRDRGVRLLPWCDDVDVIGRVREATDDFVRDATETMPCEMLGRETFVDSFESWYADKSKDTLLVSGEAGSGKSVAIAQVARRLLERGATVLAFRLDSFLEAKSVEELGEQLIRVPRNPATVLPTLSSHCRPYILIDQLDAVSEIGGRRARVRVIVQQLLRQAPFEHTPRVVVTCRAYDLEHDRNLKALARAPGTTEVTLGALDWKHDIAPTLAKRDLRAADATEQQRALLCLPVNLATLLSAPGEGEISEFASSADLLNRLVDNTRLRVKGAGENWSVWAALQRVADFMSRRQVLMAPRSVLDGFSGGAELLASCGLLTLSRESVRFRHESFFDAVFARGFAASDQTLGQWLWSTEQHLFKRGQVRQLLAYLRALDSDGKGYARALDDVLLNGRTRYLIKQAASAWLSSVLTPSTAEVAIVRRLATGPEPCSVLRQVVRGHGWFAALNDAGVLGRWIDDSDAFATLAIDVAGRGAQGHPQEAAEVLSGAWWQRPRLQPWVLRQLSWIKPTGDADPLLELFLQIVDVVDAPLLSDLITEGTVFEVWRGGSAEAAATLLGAAMKRRAELEPEVRQFGSTFSDSEPCFGIVKLAEQAPSEFLAAVLGLFVEEVRSDDEDDFDDRFLANHGFGGQTWAEVVVRALRECSAELPELTAAVEQLQRCNTRFAKRILLAVAQAHPKQFASVFAGLVNDPTLFDLRHSDGSWHAAATTAAAVRGYLNEEVWLRFEARVFAFNPEHKEASHYASRGLLRSEERAYALATMREFGRERWEIIQAVGEESFTPTRSSEIEVLARKFGSTVPHLTSLSGGAVHSPIPEAATRRMSDDAWIAAIAQYDQGWFPRDVTDLLRAGAVELSRELERRAAEKPHRFSNLIAKLPATSNHCYVVAVLNGMKNAEVEAEHAVRAIRLSRRFVHEEVEGAVVSLCRHKPEVCHDYATFELLLGVAIYGRDPTPSSQTPKGLLDSSLSVESVFSHGRLFGRPRGFDADRRSAWEALASVAEAVVTRRERILSELDALAPSQVNPNVLPALAHAAEVLQLHDAERSANVLVRIASLDSRVVATLHARRVYATLLRKEWPQHEELLIKLMRSDNDAVRAMAYALRLSIALRANETNVLESAQSGETIERLALAYVSRELLFEGACRTPARDQLIALMHDPAEDVRRQIRDIDWEQALARPDLMELAVRFVESECFEEHAHGLVRALLGQSSPHPSFALRVATSLLARVRERPAFGRDIARLVTAAAEEFEGDAERVREALNLLDEFLQADIYGANDALSAYDRV